MSTYNYGFSSRTKSKGRINAGDKSKTNFDAKHKEHNNNASFATTALLMMLTVLISYVAGTLTDLAGSAADVSGIYHFVDEPASVGDDNGAVYAMSGGVDGIDETDVIIDDYYDDYVSSLAPDESSVFKGSQQPV